MRLKTGEEVQHMPEPASQPDAKEPSNKGQSEAGSPPRTDETEGTGGASPIREALDGDGTGVEADAPRPEAPVRWVPARRRWRSIALVALLCLAGLGAIVTLLIRGAEEQNLEARNLSQVQFAALLSAAGEQLGTTTLDYAWWDEAYEKLAVHYTPAWAEANLAHATVMGPDKPVQGALVVGPDGALRFGFWRGETAPPDILQQATGGLGRLIERARQQAPSAPEASYGIVQIGDMPVLASVAPILPFTEPGDQREDERSDIIFLRSLDAHNLDAIGSAIGASGAELNSKDSAKTAKVPLISFDGRHIGSIAWEPPAPGRATLTRLTPQISIVVIVMALLAGLAMWQISNAQHRAQVYLATIDAKNRRIANNLKLWHSTMEGIDDGIIVFDEEGRLLLWNAAYGRIWNMPAGMLQHGRRMTEMMDWTLAQGGFRLTSQEPNVTQIHPRETMSGGRWLWQGHGKTIEVRRLEVPDIGGFISISRDMTQSKHYERELVKAWEQAVLANRAKSEFLANVSHELRTPLNAIIGFSEVLEAELFGPLANERYRSYVSDIKSSGLHLLSLINDILDLSKIEAGKFELRVEPMDCRDLLESVARLIRPRAESGELSFTVNLPSEMLLLHADRRALKQILINLLSNAVKFTPAGGTVEMSCHAVPNGVAFVIRDTGIGISAKDVDTALSPFGQIDSNLARRYEGTGLGLPIVKGICELHGGKLQIESEVNRGTVVTATILDQRNRPNLPQQPGGPMGRSISLPRF
ncbi:ATP-binding protein [Dongia soli]|uniref:histidine kinase n=1 Tax=Dongia soli TaxID=600628 RepID=A0ABU5EFC7_9PROT|nr:ATP-binding protein [Dongia soli]MDY0884921.1 ATP-binding protein [Dongia soli]